MDKEQLLSFLEKNHISFREMINFLPLGARPGELWTEVLSRRRDKSISLPLHDANGHPYWYITTDRMVEASNRIIEDFMAQATTFDPFRTEVPSSLLEEAYFTSYVEGFTLSLQDAMAFLQANREPRDIREQLLLNNRNTLAFLCANLYPTVDERYLQTLSYFLTDKMDNGNGLFRQADTQRIPFMQNERYVLPPAMSLMDRLREIIRFLGDNNVHPLIRAAVGQIWPIAAQPFQEGNERLGRMISLLILYRAGYTFLGDVALSSLISRSTYAYYNALTNILREENGGDLTYFIAYFLDLLAKAVEERPGMMEQRRIMEQTVIVDEDCIVTEGTVTDTDDIVTDNSSSGKRRNSTERGGDSTDSGSASNSAGLGEMQEGEGGEKLQKKLKAIIQGYTGQVKELAELLVSMFEDGIIRFRCEEIAKRLSFDKTKLSKIICKFIYWSVLQKEYIGESKTIYYRFATEMPIAEEEDIRFINHLKKLKERKNNIISSSAAQVLKYYTEGRASFTLRELRIDINIKLIFPSQIIKEIGDMGAYLYEEKDDFDVTFFFHEKKIMPEIQMDRDESLESSNIGDIIDQSNIIDPFTDRQKMIIHSKFYNFISLAANGFSKKCAEFLLEYLRNGTLQFTAKMLQEQMPAKDSQVYSALSTLQKHGLIQKLEKKDEIHSNRLSYSFCSEPPQNYSMTHNETEIAKSNILSYIENSTESTSKMCASLLLDYLNQNIFMFKIPELAKKMNSSLQKIKNAISHLRDLGIVSSYASVSNSNVRTGYYTFCTRKIHIGHTLPDCPQPSLQSTREKMDSYVASTNPNNKKTKIVKTLLEYADRKQLTFTKGDLVRDIGIDISKLDKPIKELKEAGFITLTTKRTVAPHPLGIYIINVDSEYIPPLDFSIDKEYFLSPEGIEYENSLKKAISSGGKNTTMACRCFILSCWNKRRSYITAEDFLSALPDHKYKTVQSAISSLLSQKVLISIPRKCEASINKNVYSYYRKKFDFSLVSTIPAAIRKKYDSTLIEIIESLQKDKQSTRCRRIGSLVSQCLSKGKITLNDYYPFMPHRSWREDMHYATQLGIVTETEKDEFVINQRLRNDSVILSPLNKTLIASAYQNFGEEVFSQEMIFAVVDYNSDYVCEGLRELTVFKVLDCKKEKNGRKYRFLVNPKDNPEYFAANTQQSFLPDEVHEKEGAAV